MAEDIRLQLMSMSLKKIYFAISTKRFENIVIGFVCKKDRDRFIKANPVSQFKPVRFNNVPPYTYATIYSKGWPTGDCVCIDRQVRGC